MSSETQPNPSTESTPEPSIGFPDGRTVDVREIDARFWTVLTEFQYQASTEAYVVPRGEKTDFASVPRPFVWFIPTYGAYTKAAILHDHLCRLSREGTFDRRDADGVFRQAMRTLGVPFIRRWVMWAAVRWGALTTREGRSTWLPDAWKVLLITLPVLAIVLPAAIVIVITLLVWYIAELLALGPLYVAGRIRAARRQRQKRVNPPSLSLRL